MTPEKLEQLRDQIEHRMTWGSRATRPNRADISALFAQAAACEVLLNRVRRFIAEVEATPGMSSDLCWCSGISDDCQRPPSCEWCMLREAASDALGGGGGG